MRAYDNESFFTVTFSLYDANSFSDRWPCSNVRGRGSFQFDKRNGDLVDATGAALHGTNGDDWHAFAEDCRAYGVRRLKLSPLSLGTSNPEVHKMPKHDLQDIQHASSRIRHAAGRAYVRARVLGERATIARETADEIRAALRGADIAENDARAGADDIAEVRP